VPQLIHDSFIAGSFGARAFLVGVFECLIVCPKRHLREIQIALHGAHDVVADDAAIAEIHQLGALGGNYLRTHAATPSRTRMSVSAGIGGYTCHVPRRFIARVCRQG